MSFQWIIDNAQEIQINKRGVVASTMARDQTVRAVSRGGIIWRFTVLAADGLRWQDPGVRSYIETIDNLDRFTPVTINFSKSSYAYLFQYQGTSAPTSITVTQGSNVASISGGSGTKFVNGDILQLTGQQRVYSVYGNVTGTTVTLNRPVLEASGTYGLTVGSDCTWTVICTQLPEWKIQPGGLIQWSAQTSGSKSSAQPFVFVEALPT